VNNVERAEKVCITSYVYIECIMIVVDCGVWRIVVEPESSGFFFLVIKCII